jgi:hypothetical protein
VPAAALANRSDSAVDAPSATFLQKSGPAPVDAWEGDGIPFVQGYDLGKAQLDLRTRRCMSRYNQAPGAAGSEAVTCASSFPPFVCYSGFFVLGGCSNRHSQ